MGDNKSKYDIEDRLISFSASLILKLNKLPNDFAGSNLRGQLTRSSTSSALNFGEFQGLITTKDQIHKLSNVLKELKETKIGLRILDKIRYLKETDVNNLLSELYEIIAIIATIIKNKQLLKSE